MEARHVHNSCHEIKDNNPHRDCDFLRHCGLARHLFDDHRQSDRHLGVYLGRSDTCGGNLSALMAAALGLIEVFWIFIVLALGDLIYGSAI